MSSLYYFQRGERTIAARLAYDPSDLVAAWASLRSKMTRRLHPDFTRDEWAYLIAFLDEKSLLAPVYSTFGEFAKTQSIPHEVYVPRGSIAVWLPNNVSLLGPLVAILLSLTGQPARYKLGSRAANLVGAFLNFAAIETENTQLREYIDERTECLFLDRGDDRIDKLVEGAAVRMVFGSDEAAGSVHAKSKSPTSVGFSFVDKHSEAWIDYNHMNDASLSELIKIFAIYGRAGCTSPKRIVLLNSSRAEAEEFRGRLLDMWPSIIADDVDPHHASDNVMACQWALANGWNASLVARNKAVIALGNMQLEPAESHLCMNIVSCSLDEALEYLPTNTQTVGYCCSPSSHGEWLSRLSTTKIHRFVPVGKMHHFNHVWDGQDFWAGCFQSIEVA
ncbi:acyl-CoA reductase [Halioglobus pacificus]|uniref:Long-chain-fatty-acyl-CoA reductase n=1 Tax=Parahalioglobus pacificus TaxID=930806 RepID=A0A919CKN2_9GAMM|nr:acyl-CoA reductase [Halioglobus pacificus]GHD33720.1 hypothetical protein GCM10007053_18440 [Halioglobus pacificus]